MNKSEPDLVTIQTPIYTLLNPDTGSRATLIGTVHVGLPAYYQAHTDLLDTLHEQGAAVHYEKALPPTDTELADADPELKELFEVLSTAMDDQRAPSVNAFGLVASRDIWSPHDGWERHDITMLDSLTFMGPQHAREKAKRARTTRQVVRLLPKLIRRRFLLMGLKVPMDKLRAGMDRATFLPGRDLDLCEHREALAIQAVDEYLNSHPGGGIALLWGAVHLPGFRALFVERGYKDESEEWITAIGPVKW